MAKIFFKSDELVGSTLSYWREYMKENELTELKLHESKVEIGSDYFWCKHFQEVGIKGEGCGKSCEKYQPRNGKSGRCRFSAPTYELTDKVLNLSLD